MPVIAFEGLDGVGKTTMATSLAEAVGGVVATAIELDPEWAEERRAVNAGNDVDARFDYFLRLNGHQMAIARGHEATGQAVTLESSIYRTVVTHRVLGSLAAQRYDIPDDIRPDRAFLLDVPEARRTAQLITRDGSIQHSSKWDEELYRQSGKVRRGYRNSDFGLTRINGARSPDELVRLVRHLAEV
jgi:thymidylate kinase